MSKVRVAMLGTGGIAGKHIRSFNARQDVEVVGGCDVSVDAVKAFWGRTLPAGAPQPPAFTDAATMYTQTKPDAVVICTPHTQHYAQAVQALDHGLHVLMEKPMVTESAQAHDLAARVEKSGKVLTIGYNTPCSPELAYLRDLIRSKDLGKLELISGYLSQGWLKGTMGKWRQDPKLSGGGQAYDSGAHPLSTIIWSVETDIAEVFAFVDNVGSPVDINSSINIRFTSGVFASMVISGNCPVDGSFMVFIFDNGKVEIDPWGASWIKVWKGRELVKYPPITGPSVQPADNFIDAVLGKAQPKTSPRHGIIHSELMDAIYESARTGKPAKPARKA